MADTIGASRTGLRISPAGLLNDIVEDDYAETYPLLVDALNPLGLAYLHVMESGAAEFTAVLRAAWTGVFLLNPATPARAPAPATSGSSRKERPTSSPSVSSSWPTPIRFHAAAGLAAVPWLGMFGAMLFPVCDRVTSRGGKI